MSDKEIKLLKQFFDVLEKHYKLPDEYLFVQWKKYKREHGKPDKVNANKPGDLQEVIAYFKEQKIHDPLKNAENFYNFYETNGWVQGKSTKKIVNWKACVKTWNFEKETKKTGINLSEYSKRNDAN